MANNKSFNVESEEIEEIYNNMQTDISRFKNQRAHGYEGEFYLT